MTKKCKILTVIGARPQFVKAATISRVLRRNGNFDKVLVHTGQHFDHRMSAVFFDELDLPEIQYNLGIASLSHGTMTGRMLEAIEILINKENPDYVMVFGDTNSTLAGALAAKKVHKKVIHIEAGLRSFDNRMPEEINRILTDRISDILFCPTIKAIENLHAKIINSGDVMLDSYNFFKSKSENSNKYQNYVLCTLHRAENTDDVEKLKSICRALNKINKEIRILLPLHPRTKKKIEELNIDLQIEMIDPVGYLEMITLMENCRLVITDSGGLQKEACFAGKFCLILRDSTEWTELVESGFNVLAGSDESLIYQNFQKILQKKEDFSVDFYGNGKAAEKIAAEIWKDFVGWH